MEYKVMKKHISNYPDPITVAKGDKLKVGEKYNGPEAWEGWIFCSTPEGDVQGWVPEQLLDIENGYGTILEDYTAKELNAEEDDLVRGIRELNGWIWCARLRDGEEGWLPAEKLRKLEGDDRRENNITRLDYQDKEIILIATAHVSKESAELVRQVIEEEHPDSICIELDEERYKNMQNPKAWEETDIVKIIKTRKVGFLIANLILGSYQKKIAGNLNTSVGGEMLMGMQSARDTGASLVLADRSIQTTFLRIWRKLSLWEKLKLIFSLIFSMDEDTRISDEDLQKLLQEDMLESVTADLRRQFPVIGEVLISERDQYLAYKIKNAPGRKIVAILGGAHVPGVRKEIYKEQDMTAISSIPAKSRHSKLAGWIIPAVVLGLIIYAFVLNLQTGLQQLSAWVLWTGVLAALFTALSLGHPLSILTSFVAAPFTALHPMLACGWFAGLVEATIKKPTVKDVQNVQKDILSLRGILRNRFLKTLLVVTMANIGGSLGTIIGGMDIIKNLF